MAGKGINRFALLDKDENASPEPYRATYITNSSFANHSLDDQDTWQVVRKRSNTAQTQPPQKKASTLIIKDPSSTVITRNRASQANDSAISPVDSGLRTPDIHVNWCGVCSQRFTSKTALQNHIKQSDNHQHYCNLCKRVFKDRNGIKNHVENSLGHEVYCNLCLSAFKDQWGLKNHFENNYSVGHEFICLTCLLGFRSHQELERHLQTGKKHVWCETCHRRFRNQDERDGHWRNTTRHKHCLQPGCDFDAPSMTVLQQHHKKDHFRCEGCKLILPSQTKLTNHYETCTFIVTCTDCGEQCAGQVKLALHKESCFACHECGFATTHEGNYHIHMTRHAAATIPCWACLAPMRTYSSLINHLESGGCPELPDPTLLTLCLGKWWYSPLYMDLDLHAQIRTGRISLKELRMWMNDGLLHPFTCRSNGCGKTFAHFSSLLLHVESQACSWDVERVGILKLEKEFKEEYLEKKAN